MVENKEKIYRATGMAAEGVHEQLRALTQLEAEELLKEVKIEENDSVNASADTPDTEGSKRIVKKRKTQNPEERRERPLADGTGGDSELVIDGNKETNNTDITKFLPPSIQQEETAITTSLMNDPNNNGGGK